MLSVLTYSSGRTLKRPVKPDEFLPKYLDEPPRPATPTLDEQAQEFAAFAAKLKAIKGQRK